MNTRVGSGSAANSESVPALPDGLSRQDLRASPLPASPLPARAASTSGNVSLRRPILRDTPVPPAALPMVSRLAAALSVSRTALTHVVSIFESVGNGQTVPISIAEDTVSELLTCLDQDCDALVSLIRLKAHGDYACMHSVAVCALMACLAQQMGFDKKQRFEAALAGLLHDVGKAFVPSRILAKPARLTVGECAIIRCHPLHGFDALDATDGVADAVKDVAQHHHERPDGCGYPHRLSGDRIAPLARMGAVCDVYDAITSNRPYKDGWDPAAAMQAMRQWAQAGQFDVKVTTAFTTVMGVHPIGSLVRLRSERLAVVSAKAHSTASGATVTAFYCLQSQRPVCPEVLEVGTPRANMTCSTYPREISEQRGRYDDRATTQGSDARSKEFVRSARIARSP
jgi:HD-GYP domain-containing protein (c-di-GMP phosphodiesterase class II)